MPDFLQTLRSYCRAKQGRVGELAEYLGVAQPHVSAWLTGKQEPSGENTLQVQAWLACASRGKPVRSRSRAANRPHVSRVSSTGVPADAEELPVWLL